MNTAGTMSLLKTYFQGKGYSEDELYATSYGPKGSRVMPETGAAHCDYVKSVRYLIEGVSAFTKRPVAVISYSMGVIVSRKAILGGKCVDTGEDLGEPLTDSIETYIGIAGPNHGAFLCSKYLILGKYVEACDKTNGMKCGSKYLDDINSKEQYEAKRIFAIQTLPDEIVGNFICGNPNPTSAIDGAEQTITVYGMQHTNVWLLTAPIQYDLLTNTKQRPAQLTLTDNVVKSLGKSMAGLQSALDSSIGQLFDKIG
ncbi:lipase (class 2) domain-containing protein [Ditylenchus destructor]|nr:lipase (class 2) domain-containing protein [Ditylenchus destructor]